VKCPTCFAYLQDTRTLVCVGSCASEPHAQATAVRGHEVRSKPTFPAPPVVPGPDPSVIAVAQGPCPTCSVVSSQEVCGY
jgi:hypothetical protein